MKHIDGNILTPQGWLEGRLNFADRIHSIESRHAIEDIYIIPGFIDLHVHGGGGADVMDGCDALIEMARWHAKHGTTSFLPTTLTASLERTERALESITEVFHASGSALGAQVLGIHMEGPFLAAAKPGAHEIGYLQEPNRDLLLGWCERYPIRVLTIAPECFADPTLVNELCQRHVLVQIGHSAASYEHAIDFLDRGVSGFTHLFNAMSGFHHRAPGIIGAALARATYAEFIPDFDHVHAGAMRSALRAIPFLYCVTDSMAMNGMPDGCYKFGGQEVRKCRNGLRLADGTLAGSTLTSIRAFHNLLQLGLSREEAVLRLATYPANYLHLSDRGRLAKGAFSDLLVLNQANEIIDVYIEGERLD